MCSILARESASAADGIEKNSAVMVPSFVCVGIQHELNME